MRFKMRKIRDLTIHRSSIVNSSKKTAQRIGFNIASAETTTDLKATTEENVTSNQNVTTNHNSQHEDSKYKMYFQIVSVYISNEQTSIPTVILLDSGSNSTFISSGLVDKLNLKLKQRTYH